MQTITRRLEGIDKSSKFVRTLERGGPNLPDALSGGRHESMHSL
jgi:hypothetical protein